MVPDEQTFSDPVWFSAESLLGCTVQERYRVESVLGSGGSGVIFAALDILEQRRVALKLNRGCDRGESGMVRFAQEGEIGAALGAHPNIVTLLGWGRHEERFPFLVFELLEGLTLEAERLRCEMDPANTLALLLPICGAVAFAHDRGVLHRDLKPQNIFLATDSDGRVTPKLLDFGIAKTSAGVSLTRSGAIVGTPAFMSPEQALDEPLDVRTDVWSMGVILFACLTGELPFSGDSHTRLLLELVSTPARSLAEVRGRLPPNLCAAIEKSLERSRSRRYTDMRAFARALKEAAQLDGIDLPEDPDPVGLPDFCAWNAPLAPEQEDDIEVLSRQGGCFIRCGDTVVSWVGSHGAAEYMHMALDLSRRMESRFGQYAIVVVVDEHAEPPSPAVMADVIRFYDQAPLKGAAQVVLTQGALGAVHRGVMSTANFVARRPYPVKVFSEIPEATDWLASQLIPGEQEARAFGEKLRLVAARAAALMAETHPDQS